MSLRKYGSLFVLAFLLLALTSFYPGVLSPSNIANVLSQVAVVGICAVGMTFVMLTGGIDLSVGSLVALTGAVGAWLNARLGLHWTLAWLGAIFVGMLCGLISGTFVEWGKMPPFIATLSMMAMARGATLLITQGYPISGTSGEFNYAGWAYLGPVPVSGLIMLMLIMIAWVVLRKTRFGTYVYAVGDEPETARLAGIAVSKVRVLVYVISGACSALGGVLMVGRLWSAQPNVGMGMELDVIAAVVLGGTSLFGGVGGVGGTLIGVLIMGFLDNGLRLIEISSYLQQVVKGAVFIGVVGADLYFKRIRSRRG
ncbi:MAG: ABC transporter permease [Synergistetes bacterium]|nr:ABC transporter permease [Synergistota bacterium]